MADRNHRKIPNLSDLPTHPKLEVLGIELGHVGDCTEDRGGQITAGQGDEAGPEEGSQLPAGVDVESAQIPDKGQHKKDAHHGGEGVPLEAVQLAEITDEDARIGLDGGLGGELPVLGESPLQVQLQLLQGVVKKGHFQGGAQKYAAERSEPESFCQSTGGQIYGHRYRRVPPRLNDPLSGPLIVHCHYDGHNDVGVIPAPPTIRLRAFGFNLSVFDIYSTGIDWDVVPCLIAHSVLSLLSSLRLHKFSFKKYNAFNAHIHIV